MNEVILSLEEIMVMHDTGNSTGANSNFLNWYYAGSLYSRDEDASELPTQCSDPMRKCEICYRSYPLPNRACYALCPCHSSIAEIRMLIAKTPPMQIQTIASCH